LARRGGVKKEINKGWEHFKIQMSERGKFCKGMDQGETGQTKGEGGT